MKYNRETLRTKRAVTHFRIPLMFYMTHFTSKSLFKILFPAFLFQMHVLDLLKEINLSVNESRIDTTTNNKYLGVYLDPTLQEDWIYYDESVLTLTP